MTQQKDLYVDERVLIWASGRDGSLTSDFLSRESFRAYAFSSGVEYCDAVSSGAGVLIIAAELLSHPESAQLRKLLKEQPAWSDIPVVVVARGGKQWLQACSA